MPSDTSPLVEPARAIRTDVVVAPYEHIELGELLALLVRRGADEDDGT
jgi:hypothetical protein